MEKAKTVNWNANALLMIADLFDFLSEQLGEESTDSYIQDLLDFGDQLSHKSEHFSYCRNPKLQKKGFRCALFRKKYILIYESDEWNVNILAVIHAKRDPRDYEDI